MMNIFGPPPNPLVVPAQGDTYVVVTVTSEITRESAQIIYNQWRAVFNDDETVHVQLIAYSIDGIPRPVTFD